MNRRAALLTMAGAAVLPAADVPRKSPEFVVDLPSGQKAPLSSYQGKVLCLGFILTTCPHCQSTAQALTPLYNELRAKGFEVLLSAINPDPKVENFIQRFKVSFPVGMSEYQKSRDYMQIPVMMNAYVPWIVFIDRNGMIRAQFTGNEPFFKNVSGEARQWAERLLAEKPGARRK